MSLIKVSNLCKRYNGLTAVENVSFQISPGEIVAFLGVNGAGKTTTLKILSGLLIPTSGEVIIGGFDVVKEPIKVKRILGYIPDHPQLYEKLTALEFLRFKAELYQLRPSVSELKEVLNKFSLLSKANHLVESLSHGMRQRLTSCAAVIHNPKVLIIDEPLVGLDPQGVKVFTNFLREYADQGNCVFLSTHSLNIAERTADRIVIINRGSIIASGTISDISAMRGKIDEGLEDLFLSLTSENYDSASS